MRYLLGLDDTDSRFGHCTTHLGYLVACELTRLGCALPVYPRLVRLNPNVPFKTRGNAAVCIEFEASSSGLGEEAFAAAERLLEEEADVENGANAALVMVAKDYEPRFFEETYERAISGIVSYRRLLAQVSERRIRRRLLGNGMGVVGATASLGFRPDSDDHTYELIAYRRIENCGTSRQIEPGSVTEMEAGTFPHTFNSYDHESGRVLVAPTGPDPVLVGVRGDSPSAVLGAFRCLRIDEPPLGHLVYATNQCTDAHIESRLTIPLKAYSAGWLEGDIVSIQPSQGGHLALRLRTGGSEVVCMVYEPSGDLRRVARMLRRGDEVRVSGGVRRASSKNPAVINVERVDVLSVSRGAFGATGGVGSPRPSRILPGTYLPSPRAQRHLTKQLIRYGRESRGGRPLITGWLEAPSIEARLR